jgi:heat shock protein HslJ
VVPDPENYVLVLNPDDTASIKADCNMVTWTFSLVDGTLTFDTVGPSTLAFCGEDSLDQLFLEMLGKGGTASLEDGRLVLELGDGSGRMIFDNGGPAPTEPVELPTAGGAAAVAPWAATMLAGLAALGGGLALRRRK